MGPEGGSGGGTVVAIGTPEDIAVAQGSHTGQFLAPLLAERAAVKPKRAARKTAAAVKRVPAKRPASRSA
jgi:excinuclease ABC subunit A